MASQYDLPYTGPQVEALLAKISELESEMPSKTSDLTNDSGFITSSDVPTKTSDLNNDSGFITNAPVAAEAARAQAAEALLATISSLQAEITRATGVEGTLQDLIDGIAAKIPSAATDQNQLADKAFVNSSIATATAEFRGTYDSLAELQAVSADENDYGYVRTTDAAGNTVYKRYKYSGGSWTFEYDLNNSSFTASQWAAINSAITAELVAKLSALPDNATLTTALAAKQDVIDDLSSIRTKANSAYQKPSGGIPASDIADGVIPDIADNLTTNDATNVLSAKQGKVLNENLTQLGQKVNGIHYTVSDADVHQVDASSIIESPTGNRLRLVYPVKQGWNIMVVTKAGKGAAVSLYDTREKAVLAYSDYIQTFTGWGYLVSAYGVVSNDGYLSISLSKVDGSSISGSEKNTLINGTTVLIYENSIIEDEVGYSMDSQTIISLASKFRVAPDQYQYSENGTRFRIVLPIESGCLIKASTTRESGIYVAIYSTIYKANLADIDPLQLLSPEIGYFETAEGVASVSGFLSISFTNGATPITDEIEAAMLESLFVSISSGLFKRVDVLEGKIDGADGGSSSESKELFLGTLLQKRITASGLDDTNASRRVSMQSAIALPFNSVSLSFNLPDGYYVGIRHGNRAENLSTNSYWFGNGSTFTFPTTSRYYRVSFGKNLVNDDCVDDVTPQEIQAFIDAGKISIIYNESHNVIKDNTESEKYVKAMMREFFNDSSLNNSLPNIPVFAHMSDMHGDAKRFSQFLDYCDFLGVDAALISGDFAALNPSNSCQYINDISDLHNTMVLPCTGNHDVRGLYTAKEQNEQVVGYLMTKNNVVVNSLEGDYPTYFYKDFPEKNIRVISLNVHELTRSQTDGCNFTQTQANWFINTLANTPSSYGVLIMFHEPEVPTVKDEQNDAFYQPFGTILIYQDGITGSPISKIIDAFISKTTATITYTTQGTSVSVQPDFTNVANGVEFIAFVCGHEHLDWVGLVSNTTNRQLILDVTCGVALYGTGYPYLANISDLPRGGNGVTQDAFNIYGIDRVHKTVRVARVGSNITSEAKDRKCMIIPYAI